jgi:inhibitor of cysteine peptidase
MERKLFSLLAAVVVFWAAVLGWNPSSRAALCSNCRGMMFIETEGKCRECGAPTASGALQLCPKCSAKLHRCEHCLSPTTAQDEALDTTAPAESAPPQSTPPPSGPAWSAPEKSGSGSSRGNDSPLGDVQEKPPLLWTTRPASENPAKPDEAAQPVPMPETIPPPLSARTDPLAPPGRLPESRPPAELPSDLPPPVKLKPINPATPGIYSSGKWRFEMKILSPGTRNEGRWGWLTYNGQKLPRGDVNDYYNTPWGPIYWVDVPTTALGMHGWMPVPLAQNRRQGRALAVPQPLLAATPVQPPAAARSPLAAPPAVPPRVQTLEINKSHNGQLARLRVGNVLVIRLPGNPASGYQWKAAVTNSPALQLTVRPQYSPPASTAGQAAAGTYTFTFQAVQPGNGSLRLYYVRPDDPTRPRDTFAVTVNVSAAAATTAAATAGRRE